MRVVIADGRAQVRSALRLLLEHEPDVSVVGEGADVDSLLAEVGAAGADLVLLDWELPGLGPRGRHGDGGDACGPATSGYHLLRALRSRCPALKTIVLSGKPEAREAAARAGADGFVSKGDPPDLLLVEIKAVVRRGTSGR